MQDWDANISSIIPGDLVVHRISYVLLSQDIFGIVLGCIPKWETQEVCVVMWTQNGGNVRISHHISNTLLPASDADLAKTSLRWSLTS